MQSPKLFLNTTTNLTSPIHIQATAEDDAAITGYVVYVDDKNVYRNFRPSVDAWIALPAGTHTLYVKAWDSTGNISSPVYSINIAAFAPPTPPTHAKRILNIDNGGWTVDNDPGVGGDCNHGSIEKFARRADPNTANGPAFDGLGKHIVVNSGCTYDDSLFYRKFGEGTSRYSDVTNYLWDFWFYIPTTTQTRHLQAVEFDLFHAVQMNDGVHEFMFGSQCNYISNQWQMWLPNYGNLTWMDTGITPCRFAPGTWHHATYFLQRITPGGYQQIPVSLSPASDLNTYLLFGTLTIDGQTSYLGGQAWSTIPMPAWAQVLGVQHQLDSAAAGVKIEEYIDGESLVAW